MATNIYGNPTSVEIKKTVSNQGWDKLVGLQYPLHASVGKGYFSKEANLSLIKNNLKQLLQTERGERVMLPNFGVSLRRFLFQQLDQQLFEEIREEILYSVNNYISGVTITRLRVEELGVITGTSNGLLITLDLKLRDDASVIFDVKVEIK